MKVTLENTSKIVTIDGVQARVWEGTTDSGVAVIAFIPRVMVRRDADCAQFERELQETRAPSQDAKAIPLRMIL